MESECVGWSVPHHWWRFGADGAGKTRLTRDLEGWLSPKLTVRHVYFGQPKEPGLFRSLRMAALVVRRVSFPRMLASGFDRTRWLYLAFRRARLGRSVQRSCDSGKVVIAERYPLSAFFSMPTPMDGPRLSGSDSESPGGMAELELRRYAAIATPDLVLVLRTDLNTLRTRKQDLTIDDHQQKVDVVDALRPGKGMVVIDAGRRYDEVLLLAKASIWMAICQAD